MYFIIIALLIIIVIIILISLTRNNVKHGTRIIAEPIYYPNIIPYHNRIYYPRRHRRRFH